MTEEQDKLLRKAVESAVSAYENAGNLEYVLNSYAASAHRLMLNEAVAAFKRVIPDKERGAQKGP